jgi:hypothetical protein
MKNNESERILKEAVVANLGYCPDIYLEKLRKTATNLIHANRS